MNIIYSDLHILYFVVILWEKNALFEGGQKKLATLAGFNFDDLFIVDITLCDHGGTLRVDTVKLSLSTDSRNPACHSIV